MNDSHAVRVLRVIPALDPEMGGPTTTIVNAAIAERRRGLLPMIVTAGDRRSRMATASARERLLQAGIESRVFLRPRGRPGLPHARWGVSPGLTIWLLRNIRRFDIVHVDYVWAWSGFAAILAAHLRGVPVVMTAHESLTRFDIAGAASPRPYKAAAKRLARRVVTRYVDLLVMTSELERADSVQAGERATVVPHAVTAEVPRAPLPEPTEPDLTIGYIGRLHPKKNVDVVLRAVASADVRTRLIVCGDGDSRYRASLRSLADELGIATRVQWRGHVDPAGRDALFRQIHVLVMPSNYECFGMAAAEAMAAGVPVIVSSKCGVTPTVQRYGCGLIVEPGDVTGLRAAIKKVACNSAWRRQARARCLESVAASYTYDTYGRRIAAVYEELLRGDSSATASSAH